MAQFGDLMIADATVLRLREQLERWFPACRTNHTKAAAKLHVVMSVTGRSGHTVRLSGERRNDGHMLRVGPWVRDRLLLFDLGYYSYRLFDRIRRNGGFFISRLKSNGNPLIVSENRKWRGRAITVAGQRLQEVLGRLQREVLDVEIEVSFYRRKYAGVRRRATTTLRLVAVRNDDTGEYHVYVTNVPADRLAASEVALAYRARWEIELLFRTWKSDFRLDELPSQRREVVEALLYSEPDHHHDRDAQAPCPPTSAGGCRCGTRDPWPRRHRAPATRARHAARHCLRALVRSACPSPFRAAAA